MTYGDLTVAQRLGYATELNGHGDDMPDHRLSESAHDHKQPGPPAERRGGHLDQQLRPRPARGQHLGLGPQRAHGLRPPQEFVQHRGGRGLHRLGRLEPAVLVQMRVDERDVHRLQHRHHLQRGEDLLQHLRGPGPGRDPAVADDPGGLVLPFPVQVVDGVLQGRVEPVVVFRGHEDERVRALDEGAPVLGVLVDVLVQPRVVRLVEDRQVQLGQVRHLDVEAAVLPGALGDPVGDGGCHPAGAGAADDDPQDGLGHA